MLSLVSTGSPDIMRLAPPGQAALPAASGGLFAGLLAGEEPVIEPDEEEVEMETGVEGGEPTEETAPGRSVAAVPLPARASETASAALVGGSTGGSHVAVRSEGGDMGVGRVPGGVAVESLPSGGAVVARGEAPPQALLVPGGAALPPALLPAMESLPDSDLGPVAVGLPDRPDSAIQTLRRAVIPPPPPSVARQMAAAIHAAPEGQVTLRLSPEELGQVTLQLRGEGDRMTLSVAVELADTAELIRRHQQELTQAFRALGYRSVTLNFADGQGGPGGGGARGDPEPEPDLVAPAMATAAPPRSSDAALDLRL